MKKAFITILAFIITTAASWACICLLVQLAAACFEYSLSLTQATGIWIIIILLRLIFIGGKK